MRQGIRKKEDRVCVSIPFLVHPLTQLHGVRSASTARRERERGRGEWMRMMRFPARWQDIRESIGRGSHFLSLPFPFLVLRASLFFQRHETSSQFASQSTGPFFLTSPEQQQQREGGHSLTESKRSPFCSGQEYNNKILHSLILVLLLLPSLPFF